VRIKNHKDLTDTRFCHLVVLGKLNKDENNTTRTKWILKCDCGNECTSTEKNLSSGDKKTCCQCEYHSNLLSTNKTHGDSKSKLYRVWYSMKERCNNKKLKGYKNYGGRGIKFCDEWKDYLNFKKWSEESGYKDGLTLERIDNNGNYSSENCRWATMYEQAQNRRSNRNITYKNLTFSVSKWEKVLGVKRGLISSRIKYGWNVDKIFREFDYKINKILEVYN